MSIKDYPEIEASLPYQAAVAHLTEMVQILRLRLQMRDENMAAALNYLNKGDYESARITLGAFCHELYPGTN